MWIAFRPAEELINKVIPDDAYYYFQTARHIVAGNGSTFDGIERHNGYHPAWMAMILPIFAAVDDDLSLQGPVDALNGTLALGALLDVLAAFLLFYLGLRLTGSALLGTLAAALHLFDPYAVFHSVDGLETSLLGVLIAGVLIASRKGILGEALTTKRAIILGILLGFLMLTRTDTVLFAGPLLLVLLFTSAGRRQAFRGVMIAGIIASLIVLPWLIWGRWYVGIWGQTSATAITYIQHTFYHKASGYMTGIPYFRAVMHIFRLALYQALTFSPLGYLLIPLLLGAFLLPFLPGADAKNLKFFIVPATFCLLLLMVNVGWRWTLHPWYYAPLYLFGCLLIPVLVGAIPWSSKLAINLISWGVGIAMVLLFGIRGYSTWAEGLESIYGYGGNFAIPSAALLKQARGIRIGHSDAGIAAYFGPPGMVNLDGVVNESARRAIREGRLIDYCLDSDIRLVSIKHESYLIPEIMGERFRLHLYPGPYNYLEVRSDPWGAPERFVAPNGVIDMGEENASRYFLAGWSVPEKYANPPLVWANAEKAEVAVTIPNSAGCIEIAVQPFYHSHSKQHRMKIILDDIEVKSSELVPGWQEVNAVVPANKADDQIHILGFRFDPPPKFTPSELGMWRDNRTLAAAVSRIRILPHGLCKAE